MSHIGGPVRPVAPASYFRSRKRGDESGGFASRTGGMEYPTSVQFVRGVRAPERASRAAATSGWSESCAPDSDFALAAASRRERRVHRDAPSASTR